MARSLLRRESKALLMVTHDRYFLDRVCDEIVELDDTTLYSYKGNYAYFLEKRDERIAAANANVARAQNLYRKELEWMRRMPSARATKARYRKEAFYELEQQARDGRKSKLLAWKLKADTLAQKYLRRNTSQKSFPERLRSPNL